MPIGVIPDAKGGQPQPATKQGLIDAILTYSADIRRRLAMREGKQLRIIPRLEYYLDDSLDYAEHIDQLLKS
jgi:ribosome-binding factor A